MADRVNEQIRLYLPNDPYYFEIDNLPLQDLLENDKRLQVQIDNIEGRTNFENGRASFPELQPYFDTTMPGRVFVRPGTFVARQQMPYTREGGASEGLDNWAVSGDTITLSKDVNSAQALESVNKNTGTPGRNSIVEIRDNPDGSNQSVVIPMGDAEDYYPGETPPMFRVDLVYAKGKPGMDVDYGNAGIGIVKGAFFLGPHVGADESRTGLQLPRFSDSINRGLARILEQHIDDVETIHGVPFSEEKIDPATGEVLYTSIPLPDDTVNLNNVEAIAQYLEGLPMAQMAELITTDELYFGLPLAYVYTPFNYVAGTLLPDENLYDIRPFFRTAELTLSERSAIVGSFKPSFVNRFLTHSDPHLDVIRAKIENLEQWANDFFMEASLIFMGNTRRNLTNGASYTPEALFLLTDNMDGQVLPDRKADVTHFIVGGTVGHSGDAGANWTKTCTWKNNTTGASQQFNSVHVDTDESAFGISEVAAGMGGGFSIVPCRDGESITLTENGTRNDSLYIAGCIINGIHSSSFTPGGDGIGF